MGISISVKSDLVLSYIENQPEGEKISVRDLAARLSVSEGTAYKAVKEAERLGLVVIRPKAGTVRVSVTQPEFDRSVSASELVRLLGLSVAVGRDRLNQTIRKLVVCDGSLESLHEQLRGEHGPDCLCLCGDRREIQSAVLDRGASLLLTSGTRASRLLLSQAERKGILVLSSPQNACSLLRLFDSAFSDRALSPGVDRVEEWMQTPDYLYYNDIIADWQRLYMDSSMAKQYPVVRDDLSLYGALDIWKAASAIPSQNILSMLDSRMSFPVVSGSDSLPEVARRLLVNNDSVAAVMDGRQLQGILTSNDLLRYYMYAGTDGRLFPAESFLSRDTTVSDGNRAVFHVHFPDAEQDAHGHIELELVVSGTDSLMHEAGIPQYRIESGTYFSSGPPVLSDSLILTCRLKKSTQSPNHFSVEAELNDDTTSYLKAILLLSAADRAGGPEHVSNH